MSLGTMDANAYLESRVQQYQGWYDKKAVKAKRWFQVQRFVAVIGATVVPVVLNLDWIPYPKYVATILSLIVAISVALEKSFHIGDQWKNYRSTEQYLGREKISFLTGDGPYKGLEADTAFHLLVERCEAQIAAENSATLNIIVSTGQEAGAHTAEN
jgi:hypothetical protein